MAIKLQIAYQKRLGLPGYSSHCFGVTVETEVSDLGDIERTNSQLYELLQRSVDQELQRSPGYVPEVEAANTPANGNGSVGSGNQESHESNGTDSWSCSPKQREFIADIVRENKLAWRDIETLAKERFNRPLKTLNKMEASGLIDELLARYGNANGGGRNGNGYSRNRRVNGART